MMSGQFAAVFPYLCFGKKSFYLSKTEGRPDVLLKRPNVMQLGTIRSFWTQIGVRTESSRCPDGCNGLDLHCLDFCTKSS
jgi:hypothetical protein